MSTRLPFVIAAVALFVAALVILGYWLGGKR
jgi:hypothetical protein